MGRACAERELHGIEQRTVAPYGNALVTTRHFAAGEVVVEDIPLLETIEDDAVLDSICDAHKQLHIRADLGDKDASLDFSLQLLSFCAADADVQQRVLALYSPDPEQFPTEPYVIAAQQYALRLATAAVEQSEALAESCLAAVAALPGHTLILVILAWVCNSYATCDNGGALYEYGSLVNHCCEGNTR